MVEIDGGGGLVEQRATQAGRHVGRPVHDPTVVGRGTSPRASRPRTRTEQLVLTNPYDQSAIVDIGFATDDGSREPPSCRASRSRRGRCEVIDMDSIAARDEAEVAVQRRRHARRRSIVGRAQLYDGGGRLGYSMTLAVAGAAIAVVVRQRRSRAPDVTERFSIYNPTEDDVEVTPLFLGIAEGPGARRPDRRAGPARS